MRDHQYTIALYADDVILSLTQPEVSVPNLMEEIHFYSQLSGYKLNTATTEVLPLHLPPYIQSVLQTKFPFIW